MAASTLAQIQAYYGGEIFNESSQNNHYSHFEHTVMGGTTPSIAYPWIPYHILSGRDVSEINERREEDVTHRYVIPVTFDLFGLEEDGYLGFIQTDPIDLTTGEIPLPKPVAARKLDGDVFMPVADLQAYSLVPDELIRIYSRPGFETELHGIRTRLERAGF